MIIIPIIIPTGLIRKGARRMRGNKRSQKDGKKVKKAAKDKQ